MKKSYSLMLFSEFIGGLIFGLGIHYSLLILGVSSNLTSDSHKLITTFIMAVILIYFNNEFFLPKRIEKLFANNDNNKNLKKKKLPLIHYSVLGVLFLFSMMFLFNPMAISAYDPINLLINGLNSDIGVIWFNYGFTYYILVILIAMISSYILINEYLIKLDQKKSKIIVIISFSLTCLSIWFAELLIQADFTLTSTIYASITVIIGVFSILFYIFFIFRFYDFGSPRRMAIGLFIFFISTLFFILLYVEILWDQYISLLSHLLIQITIAALILVVLELFFDKDSRLMNRDLIQKKMSYSFLLIIIILYGTSVGIITHTRKIETPKDNNVSILVWNIHNGIGDDNIFDLDRIVREIEDKNPDIIGLNEVDLGALKTSSIDLPSYFGHKLNMYYFYGYTFYKHYGNLLLSKFPILNARIIALPRIVDNAEPRSMIRVELSINSSIWTVFITHLSTESDDRLEQVPFIVNKINEEILFERIIWMGDFNLEPTSIEYSLINSTTSLNFKDSYRILNSDPGYTGDFDENHIPQKRIDYIICSPELTPLSSKVFCSISSDHCALMTEF